MILGIVCGSMYSTINHKYYDGKRILLVEMIRPDGSKTGDYLLAIDNIDSGAGETVLIIDEGNSARQVLNSKDGPVRSVIIGVVDEICF